MGSLLNLHIVLHIIKHMSTNKFRSVAFIVIFIYILYNLIFLMTLAALRPKTIVVGVSDTGHRVAEDHPNHNPRITQVVVDALRELNEEGIGYGCLSIMFGISRGYIAQICRYEKRVSYATRYKTIQVR